MIKYPNDIIVKNKKIAGILTDVIHVKNKKYCIVGVGVNVNNNFFPSEIPNAISIKQIISKSVKKNILINNIFSQLNVHIKKKEDVKEFYLSEIYGAKKYIPCLHKGNLLNIKISDVNEKGFITILTDQNITQVVNHLEVKFLLG